jgi:hypothetical protein
MISYTQIMALYNQRMKEIENKNRQEPREPRKPNQTLLAIIRAFGALLILLGKGLQSLGKRLAHPEQKPAVELCTVECGTNLGRGDLW